MHFKEMFTVYVHKQITNGHGMQNDRNLSLDLRKQLESWLTYSGNRKLIFDYFTCRAT